jgi:hypothetical protein
MSSIFCRESRPSYWNPAVPASPHPDYTLRDIYIHAIVLALPPALERHLVKRFLLLKELPAASSNTPLAPNLYRVPYAPGSLSRLNDGKLCNEIRLEAELIDRTLHLPEGAVSGLSRHHLLAIHLTRMRQLWQEFSHRRWPGGWLPAYRRALGLDFTPGLQSQQP